MLVLLIGFQNGIADAPFETIWLPEKAIQDTNSIWRNSIGYLQIAYKTWNAPVRIFKDPGIFSDTLLLQKTFRNTISNSNVHLISMYGHNSDLPQQELKIADDFKLSNLFAKISLLDSLKIDNLLWLKITYNLIEEKTGWIFVDSLWSTNYNSVVFFESNKILYKYVIPISLFSSDSTMMKFYPSADEEFSISKPVKLYFEPSNNHSGKNIGTSPEIKILDVKGDFIKVLLLDYKNPNEMYWIRWKDKKGKLKILTIDKDEC
jgi:hypothetical protein